MGRLPHAGSFHDLLVYQKARKLAQEIFEVTKGFPKEEMYSLTDQMRRSSRAIGAHIAEAWAKRRYEKHFVSKLTDADAEQYETRHWIETATDCGYLTTQQASNFTAKCVEIGRLLGGMMDKAHLFCGPPPKMIREPVAEYFVTDH